MTFCESQDKRREGFARNAETPSLATPVRRSINVNCIRAILSSSRGSNVHHAGGKGAGKRTRTGLASPPELHPTHRDRRWCIKGSTGTSTKTQAPRLLSTARPPPALAPRLTVVVLAPC